MKIGGVGPFYIPLTIIRGYHQRAKGLQNDGVISNYVGEVLYRIKTKLKRPQKNQEQKEKNSFWKRRYQMFVQVILE